VGREKKEQLKAGKKRSFKKRLCFTPVTLKFTLRWFLESRDAPKTRKTQVWQNFVKNEACSSIFRCKIRFDPWIFFVRTNCRFENYINIIFDQYLRLKSVRKPEKCDENEPEKGLRQKNKYIFNSFSWPFFLRN